MALNRSAHSLSPTDYTPSSLSFPVFSAPPPLRSTSTLQRTSASRPSIKLLQQHAPRHPMSAVPLTLTFFSTLPPIPPSSMSAPASSIYPAQARASAGRATVESMLASFPYLLLSTDTDWLAAIRAAKVAILSGQHPQQLQYPSSGWRPLAIISEATGRVAVEAERESTNLVMYSVLLFLSMMRL